ncbi:MAG: insulinase family protein [Fidelibacterota bacterium]|nr:MAG: insulinase family protein [Candidatus Neomarinimicrobiota bacterium]
MKDFKKIRQSGGITEYRFTVNDLTVLLMEEHSAPVATFMVTYRVGSRNEAIGYTGSTHLLEHLMFKGSQEYNEERGNSIWTVLQNVGAKINATTWLDRTNYFEMLPSEHLETAIAIEADRMRQALIQDSDRQPEMTVVRNEFERGENDPWETLDKNLWATAYQAHPYHHSTIGWRSDIEGVSTERLRQFYDTFYWPNNAIVTVIGDFDTQQVLSWIKAYFGQYQASPQPIPEMYTTEPKQEGPRRFIVRRSGETGIIGIAFKTPEGLHPDKYPLAILRNILGTGKTSRFYRTLVDKGLASSVFVWDHPFRDAALFMTYAFLTPETGHQEVEQIILDEYERVKAEGVTREEVERTRAMIKAEIIFSRDGCFSIAAALNEAIAIGDWTYYTTYLDHLGAVNKEDVDQAARTYLVENHSTIGWFEPVTAGEGDEGAPGSDAPGPITNGPRGYRSDTHSPPSVLEDAPTAQSAGRGAGGLELAGRIHDEDVLDGLRLVTMPMQVAGMVTIVGSLYGGDIFNPGENDVVAEVTTSMLDKGTKRRDQFAVSGLLESVGAQISFNSDDYRLNFSARCLKENVPLVVELLAEQLREPAFNKQNLTTLQKRIVGNLRRRGENTDYRARVRFSQISYPANHPNFVPPLDKQIGDVESITASELRGFHSRHLGLGSMIIVATGDLDRTGLEQSLHQHFSGWQMVNLERPSLDDRRGYRNQQHQEEIVTMRDKTSVDLVSGLVVGIDREHPDYLPLSMGTYILGGNFSARLMATVRDKEGLTYGLGSSLGGADNGKDGYWTTQATFAPGLLEQGRTSILAQLEKWVKHGVTAEELEVKKTTLVGNYKVGLATTSGMAATLLDILERGKDCTYIDEYVDEINALVLDEINTAISKYILLDNLTTVAAGSIDQEWQPLDGT